MSEIIKKARRSLSFGRELENLTVPKKDTTDESVKSPSLIKRFRRSLTFGKSVEQLTMGSDDRTVSSAAVSTTESETKPSSICEIPKVQTSVQPTSAAAVSPETPETPVSQYTKDSETDKVVLVRRFSKAQSAKSGLGHLRDGAGHRVEIIGRSGRFPSGEAAALDAIAEVAKSPVSPLSPSIFDGEFNLLYFAIPESALASSQGSVAIVLTDAMLKTLRQAIDDDMVIYRSRKQMVEALEKLDEHRAALEKRRDRLRNDMPQIVYEDNSVLSAEEVQAKRLLATIEEELEEAGVEAETRLNQLDKKREEYEMSMHAALELLVGLIGEETVASV